MMKIEKRTKIIDREVIVTPAKYKDVDTGRKQIVEIVENGETRKEERSIYDRVLVDAERQIKKENQLVFIVNDGVDEHEFINQQDAKEFIKGVK